MLGWLKQRLRKGLGARREHGPVIVQGRQLRCNVCSNDTFWAKRLQLHTPVMTFLNLEEWNRVADCAICERCGHIHWFVTPVVGEESADEQDRAVKRRPGGDGPA